jgi:hypothetical protein
MRKEFTQPLYHHTTSISAYPLRPLLQGFLLGIVLLTLVACGGEKTDESKLSPSPQVVQVRVVAAQAPVFEGASSNAPIIINLFEGDMRRVVGQSSADAVGIVYFQIDLGNRTGWVAQTQVELIGDSRTIALVIPSPTILPAATLVPATNTPTSSPTATATDIPSSPVAPHLTVNVSRAIVFAEPNRTASEIATLFEGETYTPTHITTPNDLGDVFFAIQLGTQQGWILRSQVAVEGDIASLPVADGIALTNPTPTLADIAQARLTQTAISSNSPAPEITRITPSPSATPTPSETENETQTLTAVPTYTGRYEIQEWVPPPLTIDLPAGWQEIHVLIPVSSQIAAGNIGMSVYEGPLTAEINGTIWVLWGFPNFTDPFGTVNLWADGVQLLRSLLFLGCNIGLQEQEEFIIDGRSAVGAKFSAVTCADGPDIAGWFAGLQVEGGNFAFFVGAEPVDRVLEGLVLLNGIMETVHFDTE